MSLRSSTSSPPGTSRGTSLDRPIRPIGITPTNSASWEVESLIAGAPKTRCANTLGLFASSVNAGLAFPLTCGRWDCPAPSCGGLKKLAARELFFQGTENAWERGERVRFVTLTAPSRGMSIADLGAGWNRVVTHLRKRGLIDQYALVVELQLRGAPHLHALATGEFIKQDELCRIAIGRNGSKGRFGEVSHIKEARTTGERSLVSYMVKAPARSERAVDNSDDNGGQSSALELSQYATKAAHTSRLLRPGGSRNRPIRSSRLWYPGGLTGAAEAVKAEWSANLERVEVNAKDWRVWRVNHSTGELVPLTRPECPIAAPEVDRRTNLALVPDLPALELQAA